MTNRHFSSELPSKPRAGGSNPSGRTRPDIHAARVALGMSPAASLRLSADLKRTARAVARGEMSAAAAVLAADASTISAIGGAA